MLYQVTPYQLWSKHSISSLLFHKNHSHQLHYSISVLATIPKKILLLPTVLTVALQIPTVTKPNYAEHNPQSFKPQV